MKSLQIRLINVLNQNGLTKYDIIPVWPRGPTDYPKRGTIGKDTKENVRMCVKLKKQLEKHR